MKLDERRQISKGLSDFILWILEKDPNKRPTAEEIKASHWLNEGYLVPLDKETDHLE